LCQFCGGYGCVDAGETDDNPDSSVSHPEPRLTKSRKRPNPKSQLSPIPDEHDDTSADEAQPHQAKS